MNNGGSVGDVIGEDNRSDGKVKNCCHDNKMASRLDRRFLFLVLLASAARLFKCRRFFFFFFFRVCVLKWGHGRRCS